MDHFSRRADGSSAVTFEPDEQWRIVRVRACERLHITPDEWDAISYVDQCDFLETWRADSVIAEDRRSSPKALRNQR